MGRLKLSRSSSAFVVARPNRARPIHALIAAAALGVIVMPIAFAGAASGPQATASGSVKKQVKKLKQQVNQLQQQLEDLSKQPGPQGPGGPQGAQGPPGPATGPAGGDLTGTYPNPLIGPAAVGSDELADGSVGSAKIKSEAVDTTAIQDLGVRAADMGDQSVGERAFLPNSVGAFTLKRLTAVVGSGVAVNAGTPADAQVSCPTNQTVIGGGFAWQDDEPNSIIYSAPSEVSDATWTVRGMVNAGSNTLYAWANCLPV